MTNTLIAVVRYFGGKKLGIPGLIHAYSEAAKDALENNELIDYKEFTIVNLSASPEAISYLYNILKKINAEIISEDFVTE